MPWYGYHSYLRDYIRTHRCRRIMEIGVYDGDNAVDLIKAASEVSPIGTVEYYGFDFFDNYSEAQVARKLGVTGCRYRLFKGDTLETLPQAVGDLPVMDLIFIDGGKSYEEAQSDWIHSSRLMGEGSVAFVHNYDFPDVRMMVDGVPKKEYDVKVIRERCEGLVAQIILRNG